MVYRFLRAFLYLLYQLYSPRYHRLSLLKEAPNSSQYIRVTLYKSYFLN